MVDLLYDVIAGLATPASSSSTLGRIFLELVGPGTISFFLTYLTHDSLM